MFFKFLAFFSFFLVGMTSLVAELKPGEKLKLKKDGQEWISVKRSEDGWKASSPEVTWKIEQRKEKTYLVSPAKEYKLKFSNNKLKIKNAKGTSLIEIKKKENKLKIIADGIPNIWSIKYKGDKLKIYKDNTNVGKVAFYSSKGKIKVKDILKNEVCTTKHRELISSPAVCLFRNLTEEQRLLTFLVLSAYFL